MNGTRDQESYFGFPISARRLRARLSRTVWADVFRVWLKKVTLERAARCTVVSRAGVAVQFIRPSDYL